MEVDVPQRLFRAPQEQARIVEEQFIVGVRGDTPELGNSPSGLLQLLEHSPEAQAGFEAVRAETAALVAVTLAQFLWGDLASRV